MEITMHEKKDTAAGSFERTFVVSVPVERAWRAMTDPDELNKWYFPTRVDGDGAVQTEIAGVERAGHVVEFEPGRMFKTRTEMTGREHVGALAGTQDMTVVLEAIESGTRITITHSGFGTGDDWERVISATMHGSAETIADLILYLETGVAFPRHLRGEKSYHGIAAREVLAGLEVREVQPGTWGQKLGLQRGDLLIEIGGAAVFGFAELAFFIKEHQAGEAAEAAWVRDGQIMRASAELGVRIPVAA